MSNGECYLRNFYQVWSFECQRQHWKIKPEKNRNTEVVVIHDANFAVGREQFIVSLRFAVFALEQWLTKGKFPVFARQVGKVAISPDVKPGFRFAQQL
jgi:hypothetical protein